MATDNAQEILRFLSRRQGTPLRRQHSQSYRHIKEGANSEHGITTKLKRRLSESFLFSMIVSQTGLGLPWVAREDEVWDQTAVYCKEFIHSKLKRLGYMGGSAKNGVRGSVAARGQRVSAVCRELTLVGSELERMYPTLYKDITKQLNVSISSEQVVEQVLFDIGDAVFKSGITWAKIVAFFVVSSSLSVECMQQGNGIFVHSITVALTRYVQTKLVRWVAQRGGWTDLLRTFRRKRNDSGIVWLLTFGGVFLGLLITALLSRAPFLSSWRPEN
uniref:BCL2L4 n=1 Tax=Paracentrotus lividus TaxID=7656 RepID=A0AAU7NIB2_PARLI